MTGPLPAHRWIDRWRDRNPGLAVALDSDWIAENYPSSEEVAGWTLDQLRDWISHANQVHAEFMAALHAMTEDFLRECQPGVGFSADDLLALVAQGRELADLPEER